MEDNKVVEQPIVVPQNVSDTPTPRKPQDICRGLHKEALLNFLEREVHPSDAHILIRDVVTTHQLAEIRNDAELAKRLKDIKKKALQSFEYDQTPIRRVDLDYAMSQLLNKVSDVIYRIERDNMEVRQAINRIEEKIGLDVTKFTRTAEIDRYTNAQDAETPNTGEGTVEQAPQNEQGPEQ